MHGTVVQKHARLCTKKPILTNNMTLGEYLKDILRTSCVVNICKEIPMMYLHLDMIQLIPAAEAGSGSPKSQNKKMPLVYFKLTND